ncbi:MAG: efflux RND transporter permease subunit, partial [Gammaproteobacteria bacterium]|nr:efflux RND transporter permease subunit [Gammaproteobacteria bacterium]
MLVDNAIVMAESIMVQIQAGKSPIAAAVDSANELKVPLLTSSLTTAAAFLPIYLAESSTGEYTAALFEVVTITLLCSWVLAITVVPLLCVRFLKVKRVEETFDNRIYRGYRAALLLCLRNRLATLAVIVALFAAAIYGLGGVPKIFFPPSDRLFFKAEIELPIGSDISATTAVVQDIERFMEAELQVGGERQQGLRDWTAYIGNGGPRFVLQHNPEPASPHYALLVLNASDHQSIDGIIVRLEDYVFDNHPNVTVTLKRFDNGPPVTNPVEVRVLGRDEDRLFTLVDKIKDKLASIPGARNIKDNWGLRTKKLRVNVNQARAQRAGLSSQDIAVSLQAGLSGIEMTEYREGADRIPIVMRSVAADRQDIGKLEGLNVFSQLTGESVPLKQVADVEIVWQSANIRRRDLFKSVTISAGVEPGVTAAEVFAELSPWLQTETLSWPVGYRYEFGGEAETSGKANESIAEKLPIGALIILLLLVGQFNSIRRPLIILMVIPLGMIGVTAGLLVLDSYMGFMTFLGIISLAGIVINNAIVLLERINIEIHDNELAPFEAIIEAAQRRLRPILLTTATTVFGLMPLYFGGGAMWEPMAIAIMAGLLFATVLTLGFVPVMYSLLFRVREPQPEQ